MVAIRRGELRAETKAQPRPRTLRLPGGSERRSGTGSGASWFQPGMGNSASPRPHSAARSFRFVGCHRRSQGETAEPEAGARPLRGLTLYSTQGANMPGARIADRGGSAGRIPEG